MSKTEVDPATGEQTTGHEWNGIKELDNPVPRGVLIFVVVTHVFAILWWFLMPAFPLGWTYTRGLLGIDQRATVEQAISANQAERASWTSAIETSSFDQIQADESLMAVVKDTGPQLFGDNCGACHGFDASGRSNYPDLTDGDWLWGDGSAEAIAETMRVGINTSHPESRFAQMPAFGRDGMLASADVRTVARYVYSLSHPEFSTEENLESIAQGESLFAENCSGCHGAAALGDAETGTPNLTDAYWLYGGELDQIIESVHGGRAGHMPTWDERLTPVERKVLALYVHSLGGTTP